MGRARSAVARRDRNGQAYRDGGIAVGAVLTDVAGAVIAEGRNQRFAGRTRGLLAHAELQALAALPPDKDCARDSVLYTTLSPCPMCLGAIVIARIGHVRLGAIDPTWLGTDRLPDLNDEVRRRWPQIHGPLPGPIGAWLAITPCLNTSGTLLRAMERTAQYRSSPRGEQPLPGVSAPARHRRTSTRSRLGSPHRLDPLTDRRRPARTPVTYVRRNWLIYSAVAANPPNGLKCSFISPWTCAS
jgi:tRNA(Arg) A34 adenosine deaminase TadA